MSALEELVQAALLAPEERKEEALRVLRGAPTTSGAGTLPPPPEPYLTLREVGKRLGLSACSLWRWKIPGHDLGGRRRFRLTEVVAYLESDEFKRRTAALRAHRRSHKEGSIPN